MDADPVASSSAGGDQIKHEREPASPGEDEPSYDDELVILDWCKRTKKSPFI